MKMIWDYINQHSLPRKTKHTLFLLVNTILFAVVRFLFWVFAVRHVSQAIQFGDDNVGRKNQILTLPTYMAVLLVR